MTRSVHVTLTGHHANPARFHQRIDATLGHKSDGALDIVYTIHGLNLDLRVPTPHAPAPADALWRTTCCELFIGTAGQAGYREFNFSPSCQWAVYDFSDYRQRQPDTPGRHAPAVRTRREENLLQISVLLPESALPDRKKAGDSLRLALSAVLEANDGKLGYWALAHPPGKPDFHHPAGFVLSLDPTGLRPISR